MVSTTLALTLSLTPRKLTSATRSMKPSAIAGQRGAAGGEVEPERRCS